MHEGLDMGSDWQSAGFPAGREELLDFLVDAPLGVFRSSLDGRLLWANRTLARMIGAEDPTTAITTCNDLSSQIYPDPADRQRLIATLLEHGVVNRFVTPVRSQNGRGGIASIHARLLRDASGAAVGLIGMVEDVTDQERERSIARLDEARLEALVRLQGMRDASPAVLADFALAQAVTLTRSSAGCLATLEPGAGRASLRCLRQDDPGQTATTRSAEVACDELGLLAEVLRGEPLVRDEPMEGPRHLGSLTGVQRCMALPIASEDRILGALAVANKPEAYDQADRNQLELLLHGIARLLTQRQRDSERAALDQRLQQAQKLELLGQFASGIAHDFSNLVTMMHTCTEQLEQQVDPATPAGELTAVLQRTALQASELTSRLLAFSRPRGLTLAEADLNELVGRTLPMLRRLLPETVELRWLPSPEPGIVRADETELAPLLANLVANSRDAMPAGGVITLSAGARTVGPEYVATHPWARRGEFVTLTVEDTGHGMPPEVLARVFEPFFTTKEAGKGTGLGLSMVFATVKRHEGMIDIASRPDEGTAVHVLLPRVSRPGRGSGEVPAVSLPGARGKLETILVAEDNHELRRMLARILKALGYRVLEAADGQEAWTLLEAGSERVDLVLADVVMPRMSGVELFLHARRRQPHLAFLFSSGYAEEDIGSAIPRQPRVGAIPKPYRLDGLASRVRELLDEGPETEP
ncbi:MAG: ATP-binding protein [Thermoanaerobaculaceae bacterium]|nr:ATP-binding protein [Thermoanaerobaculaceae bacterium]